MRYRPIEERFAEKYTVNPGTKCWEWNAMKVSGGYGMLSLPRGGGHVLAHRFSYEHHRGVIPEGMLVLHRCHNPGCVNPAHLKLGTHADNMKDMADAGRRVGRNKGTILTERQVQRLDELFARGVTQQEAANILGVHRSTVYRLYRYRRWVRPSVKSILSDEQKAEAVKMLAAGDRVMAVAKHFGVDRKTIRKLRPEHIPSPPLGRPRRSQPS